MTSILGSLLLLLVGLWSLPWKGFAMWRAARNGHKKWFVALFLLNTLGILDMAYIFYFAKLTKSEKQKSQNYSQKPKTF